MLEQLTDRQERTFVAHILDLFEIVQLKYTTRFSNFLDARQLTLARKVSSSQPYQNFLFFGGHADGERVMLGVFAPYEQPDPGIFPIVPLTIQFRTEDRVGHRDILGALIGLEIKREAIGDILIGEGVAVCFLTPAAAPLVRTELHKIGRCGVKVAEGMPEILPALHHYKDLPVNISSLRLDCMIAAATGVSREKAVQTIRAQLVSIGGMVVTEPSHTLSEGDVISVRGFGKLLFAQVLSTTKKGRLQVLCKKYI